MIAAGGLGTRLTNFRNSGTTKMLLEVNGVPMINRQIQQMIQWGMDNFVIITNPEFKGLMKDVIQERFPEKKFEFAIQEEPKGISHALLQAKEYLKNIDRQVQVETIDGNRVNGRLISFGEQLVLQKEKNRISEDITIPVDQIKETKLVLKFK